MYNINNIENDYNFIKFKTYYKTFLVNANNFPNKFAKGKPIKEYSSVWEKYSLLRTIKEIFYQILISKWFLFIFPSRVYKPVQKI